MLSVYRKLYDILDSRERSLTVLVFLLLLMVAFVETMGVASIMPFMAVLANPEVVETNRYLAEVYTRLGFESTDAFLFFLGVVFLILIVGSLVLRAFAFWVQLRFSHMRNHVWGTRLIGGYLAQPYDWFLGQHSGDLGASVLNEVSKAVHGVLFPAMQIISHGLVAAFLFLLMVAVDPLLATSIALFLGVAYGTLFWGVRSYLRRIGEERRASNSQRFKIVQEAFGGIKDVKVAGLEEEFTERFRVPSLRVARREVTGKVVSQLPSFAMQAAVFGGIMVVLLYFLGRRGGFQEALPVFSLYALAGYRLMPSLQAIYGFLAELRFNGVVLDAIHRDLHRVASSAGHGSSCVDEPKGIEPMGLRNTLRLDGVSYRYPGAARYALADINLEVKACSTIGLVGPTGSGKTTLVDVILALLKPEQGRVIVDDQPITPQLRRMWQKSIGYVPQQIYLADDSIERNIAFGISSSSIDREAVERAARAANLHEFVMNELPQGYQTPVGERGVRLSGGQRQRIGIARALYHDPDVLILDEATSALDNLTEQAVMDAVHNLSNRKTIVLIAHRLSTVRECDQIFYLEQGRIVAVGTYDELLATNSRFRLLAGAGN
jgi:ATP-binding cassette, subfamily B, bacterial PglK